MNYFGEQDARLYASIRGIQNGIQESYQLMYNLSYQFIYKSIFDLVKDRNQTDFLTQNVYQVITQNVVNLGNPEYFYVWAGRIATDYALSYIRNMNPGFFMTQDAGPYDDLPFAEYASQDEEAFIPESILTDHEKLRILEEELNKLTVEQRICVQYFYYEELSVTEIAQRLNCSNAAVQTQLKAAKEALKNSILSMDPGSGTRLYSLASVPLFLILLRNGIERFFAAGVIAAGGAATASVAGGSGLAAGSGVAGSGMAAGSGVAGSGMAAGSGVAGSGMAAGPGVAGSGMAAGSGVAGSGMAAGSGVAGSGMAGSASAAGMAGTGAATTAASSAGGAAAASTATGGATAVGAGAASAAGSAGAALGVKIAVVLTATVVTVTGVVNEVMDYTADVSEEVEYFEEHPEEDYLYNVNGVADDFSISTVKKGHGSFASMETVMYSLGASKASVAELVDSIDTDYELELYAMVEQTCEDYLDMLAAYEGSMSKDLFEAYKDCAMEEWTTSIRVVIYSAEEINGLNKMYGADSDLTEYTDLLSEMIEVSDIRYQQHRDVFSMNETKTIMDQASVDDIYDCYEEGYDLTSVLMLYALFVDLTYIDDVTALQATDTAYALEVVEVQSYQGGEAFRSKYEKYENEGERLSYLDEIIDTE